MKTRALGVLLGIGLVAAPAGASEFGRCVVCQLEALNEAAACLKTAGEMRAAAQRLARDEATNAQADRIRSDATQAKKACYDRYEEANVECKKHDDCP